MNYELANNEPITTERRRAVVLQDGSIAWVDCRWNNGQLKVGRPYQDSEDEEIKRADYLAELNRLT